MTREPSGEPSFLPALTGVRAFAALWVMLLHLTEVTSVLLPEPVARGFALIALPGFLGVDVFFVLSGFIISYNYDAKFVGRVELGRYLRFLRARLARIYPVHLVLLLALVAVVRGVGVDPGAGIDPSRWSTAQLIESLLLIHAWVGHTGAWNSVSWSISSEWLAYLLFPALGRIARAVVGLSVTASWAALVVIALLPAIRAFVAGWVDGVPALPPLQIVSEFLVGCITYQLFALGRGRGGLARWPGAILAALVTMAAGLHHWHGAAGAALVVPLVAPLLLGLAHGDGRVTRVFSHPIMVYGGKISFALYMTHYLWLWVMHYLFPLASLTDHALPVRVAWVLAHALPMPLVAAATYHLVEEPARRWLVGRR